MIISKIAGGLGNQLFQYAAGRSLALHHNSELLLDTSYFNENDLRNFDLGSFNVNMKIADPGLVKNFINRSFADKIRDKFFPVHFKKVYKEPFFHFDKRFFNTAPNVYLKGYWQSEKYFATIKEIIKTDLAINPGIVKKVRAFGDELANTTSVAVHIRRADYTSEVSGEYHGIPDKNYYQKAIQLVKEKNKNARFYFFSDNINWVKENMQIPDAVYVSDEITKTHLEDLYLMSQCRHNIIANSSFSWWGAWLNNNPGKIVIAPKNWFNKGPKDTYDLYPDGWIII
jgi:hypothetical protein